MAILPKLQQINREFYSLVDKVKPECQKNPNLFDPDLWPKQVNGSRYDDQGFLYDPLIAKYYESMARETCQACPIKAECLDFAIVTKNNEMVFGGLTPNERRDLISSRR